MWIVYQLQNHKYAIAITQTHNVQLSDTHEHTQKIQDKEWMSTFAPRNQIIQV